MEKQDTETAARLEWTRFNGYLLSDFCENQGEGQPEQFEVYATDDGTQYHTICWRGHFRFLRNRFPLPTEAAAKAACEHYNATGNWGNTAHGGAERWEEVWHESADGGSASAGFAEGRWYMVEPSLENAQPVQWVATTGSEPGVQDGTIEQSPPFTSLMEAKAACEHYHSMGKWN